MTNAHRWLLKWARTLHVYLTMFGFILLLFFAVTGFMLNHETWFLPTQTTTGTIPLELLGPPEDRDSIVEHLRSEFGAQGELESFVPAPDEKAFRVKFQSSEGPSEAIIQRDTGTTVVTIDSNKASREHIVYVEGKMPMELLVPDDPTKELPIVEKLRKEFGARGEVIDPPRYDKAGESFSVTFKAPSYDADVTIRASDGHTKVRHRSRGINGVLLDLHRGKESGLAWSVVIDGISILFVIVSITGIILWSSLRWRAQHGFAVLMIGLVLSLVVYFAWVPR